MDLCCIFYPEYGIVENIGGIKFHDFAICVHAGINIMRLYCDNINKFMG